MSLGPSDLVVSRHSRLQDGKLSEAHLRAAIEERARRLAEMGRMPGRTGALPVPPRRKKVVKRKYRIQREILPPDARIQAPPDDTASRALHYWRSRRD